MTNYLQTTQYKMFLRDNRNQNTRIVATNNLQISKYCIIQLTNYIQFYYVTIKNTRLGTYSRCIKTILE